MAMFPRRLNLCIRIQPLVTHGLGWYWLLFDYQLYLEYMHNRFAYMTLWIMICMRCANSDYTLIHINAEVGNVSAITSGVKLSADLLG